jgi:hypothetical protein
MRRYEYVNEWNIEDEMEYQNDPLLKHINKQNIESIKIALALGAIVGFLIGLVVSSYLHKYIVHPLGY